MRLLLTCLCLCVLAGPAFPRARAADPAEWAAAHSGELFELYCEFHRHPELSLLEEQTARRLADAWEAAGYEVTRNVGGHGVVGWLDNGPGPCLMLRCDLDALPVTEQTGLVYASQVTHVDEEEQDASGVMHACGHDIHMTNLVGVAQFLATHRDAWSGRLLLIGQPAEERGQGAAAMLDDGLFERFPKPDFALALHVDAELETGKVGYRAGYALANVDSVDIRLIGRGGHGAHPHTTIDPIVQAAHLVLDLQSIVSREVDPLQPAVVTVGSIHGGTKHNIIGDHCHLQITVRSYTDEVRQHLLDAIRRKALAVAASHDAPEPTIEITDGTPALYNNDELVARIVPVFREVLGEDNVVQSDQSMGGEDFSRYGLAGVPIFMYRLGSVLPERLAGYERVEESPPSLHSAVYYPDAEPTLVTGVTTMSAAVLDLLPPSGSAN